MSHGFSHMQLPEVNFSITAICTGRVTVKIEMKPEKVNRSIKGRMRRGKQRGKCNTQDMKVEGRRRTRGRTDTEGRQQTVCENAIMTYIASHTEFQTIQNI